MLADLALIPPDLSTGFALLLVAVSFLTSALTAGLGIGGGVALLAVMAYGMPVAALIPVHGVVQIGSNLGRFVVQRAHVDWRAIGYFVIGAVVGAMLGGRFVVALPEAWLGLMLGGFVLVMTWVKIPKLAVASPLSFTGGGLVGSFLTMFFGATGPFVAAVFGAAFPERLTLVATHAAAMVIQHGLKVIVFGLLGFAFTPYLALLAAMIATGFLGTLAGTALLKRLPEARFRTGFKIVLTLLALDLIRRGLVGLF